VEIGSINRVISLLGTGGISRLDPVSRNASRGPVEPISTRYPRTDDLAYRTNFSKQALEQSQELEADRAGNNTELSQNELSQTELSEEEEAQLQELKQRDREVRQHEQAHKAAAGKFAIGGPSYEFERGPDGNQYAVGGEVQIDVSPVPGDPEATIRKMRQVAGAARAPSDPSSTDQKVAAAVAKLEVAARTEQRDESIRESQGSERVIAAYSAGDVDRRGQSLDLVA
jgi:hypothetical protein